MTPPKIPDQPGERTTFSWTSGAFKWAYFIYGIETIVVFIIGRDRINRYLNNPDKKFDEVIYNIIFMWVPPDAWSIPGLTIQFQEHFDPSLPPAFCQLEMWLGSCQVQEHVDQISVEIFEGYWRANRVPQAAQNYLGSLLSFLGSCCVDGFISIPIAARFPVGPYFCLLPYHSDVELLL